MTSPPKSTFLRWVVPSLGSVLVLAALANTLFFRRHLLFAFDGDVGRHIRVGRTILEMGAIPRVDLFSHTRLGDHFVPYEWLSETITAFVEGVAGLPGVVVLSALLYAAAVLAVYRASEELGAPRIVGFMVALLALFLQSVHLLPRPHLFTTAFAGVFVIVLLRFARTGRLWALAPLPPLMLVWANSHGGFLIGFILLAAFIAGALLRSPEFGSGREAVRPLVTTLFLCLVASLVNPAGVELWRHTTGYLGIDFLVAVTHEYQSVDFHEPWGKLFFVAAFAGPVLWMTARVRVSWLAAGLYLFFTAAALHSARNIPLFTVAALPWLAVWIHEALLSRAGEVTGHLQRLDAIDRQLRPGLSTLLLGILLWYALDAGASSYRFQPDVFPVAADEAIEEWSTAGPVFNQMAWGGYLLYQHPGIPVFIDGQTDFYGEALSRDYLTLLKARSGWRDVLERHAIEWTLTGRDEPVVQLLDLDPSWIRAHADPVAVIFVRRGTGRISAE